MSNMIVVFTLNGCYHCVDLKNKLISENIPFNEIEITSNKDIWDNVVKQTGYDLLPSVYISIDEDKGIIFVPERDYQDHDELINKINNILDKKED